MTPPLAQTEVTDAQWIQFCRAQLMRKGTPPDGTLPDPQIPLLDRVRANLIRLLDEVEAEPHAPNVGSKIGDVIFAIGILDVTGQIGPLDTGRGTQTHAPRF